MKATTIKINSKRVAASFNRAKLISELIKQDKYSLEIDIGRPDFSFFFSKDLKMGARGRDILKNLLNAKKPTKTIFDVSDNFFGKNPLEPLLILCIVCSGFVTCSSEDLQEKIYQNTGRLAYILNNNNKNITKALKLAKEDDFFDKLENYSFHN